MGSRFKVVGQFNRAGRSRPGTVIIDRDADTFTVRPYRSRRTYTLSLSLVAEIAVERIVKAEARLAMKDKGGKKRKGRK